MSEDMTDKVRVTIDVDVDSVDLSDEVAQRVVDIAVTKDNLDRQSKYEGNVVAQSMSELPVSEADNVDYSVIPDQFGPGQTDTYELLPAVHIIKVDYKEFVSRIDEVVCEGGFYAKNIDVKPDYTGYDCWLSDDGTCGFAISPERELTNVFSLQNGRGKAMMQLATSLYDRLTLNCFDGYLRKFYEYHGFQEDHREENYDGEGRDVVYMSYEFEQ